MSRAGFEIGSAVAILALLASLFLLLVGVSAASASKGTIAVVGASATGLAVNEATGDLYAVEHAKVTVYDEDGNFLFSFGSPGSGGGQMSENDGYFTGIAINQSTGDVYVYEGYPNLRIQQFDSLGNFIRAWGYDVDATKPGTGFEICTAASGDTCQAGADGSAPGQFSSNGMSRPAYLTVDAANGNVIMADGSNNGKRLQVFTETGEFVRTIGTATDFEHKNDTPSSVAVNSTGVVFAAGWEQRVKTFTRAGASLGGFGTASVRQIAIDPTDTHVFLTQENEFSGEWEIAEYEEDGTLVEEHAIGIPAPWGMALNSATGRIYVSDKPGGQLLVIGNVATPPVATISPATEITAGAATLHGTVNPEGSEYDTHWHFVCTPACPEVSGGDAGNGTGDVPVSATATGLDPHTTYQVRLVATREFGAGSAVSGATSFTTDPIAPTLSLVGASRVTATSARLGAAINPQHSATTYHFEFGPDTGYGSFAPAGEEADAGETLGQVPAFQTISGLSPNTTYHFKLVAENSAGAVESEDVSFTTRTTAEAVVPQRGVELVTPPDKGNQTPYGFLAPDGEHVAWATYTGGPGAPIGMAASFLATRTPTGWQSRSIVPPSNTLIGNGTLTYNVASSTPNYSSVIFQVGVSPFDGGIEPPAAFVRLNPDGTQSILEQFASAHEFEYGATVATSDLSHVFVATTKQIDSSQPEGVYELYDLATSPPTLISRLPNGGVAQCGLHLGGDWHGFGPGTRWVSEDGSRVYFMTSGNECGGPVHVYMYDSQGTPQSADDTVTKVAGAPVSGEDSNSVFLRASKDGKEAMIVSDSRLTAEDTNSGGDIYRWDVNTGLKCLTCVVPNAEVKFLLAHDRHVAVSEDLSHVYFNSDRQLVEGKGREGGPNLYVWHHGTIDYVGPITEVGSEIGQNSLTATSSDGDTLVFASKDPGITPDPTGGRRQYYLYSDKTGSIECVSCAPPGAEQAMPEAGGYTLPSLGFAAAPGNAEARRLSADGQTFVFTTAAALVPRDVNGGLDVYEWHNGKISLVTDGVSEFGGNTSTPLELLGISSDGVNVLFKSGVPLTGYEHDSLGQIYDARAGGGFGPPPPPPAVCNGDACQGPLVGEPRFVGPGSATSSGPGNERATRKPQRRCPTRAAKKSCVKRHAKKRHGKPSPKRGAHGGQGKRSQRTAG